LTSEGAIHQTQRTSVPDGAGPDFMISYQGNQLVKELKTLIE